MLAILLIFSILCGAVAAGATQMLGLPLWTTILGYSLGGAFGLLCPAVLLSLEGSRPQFSSRLAAVTRQTGPL